MSDKDGASLLPAETRARVRIDQQLTQAGWKVQDKKDLNLFAGQGIAVREVECGSKTPIRCALYRGGDAQEHELKEVAAMMKEIELHLADAAAPSGEIPVKDLAALVNALQELTTRISRDVINTAGPGRTKQFVEELSQLRLHAVEAGSTILRFSKGPTDKLDVDLPEQAVADDRFWEIVQAMGKDRRLEWATDLIAESVGKLVNAIQAAAPTVVLGSPSRPDVRIVSSAVHAETWTPIRVHPGGIMTATGRLEKVDIRSHEFRVRDDVDHTVDLKHVQSDTTAAQLVGQWVVARGDAVLHESGRLVVLDNASVSRVDDPAAEHMDRSVTTLDEILASAPGPNMDGGIDLSEDEATAFLAALRS